MNNRQAGRRRGRSGQRPQGSGGNRDNGNRIDNRARGNAPQLLEKYKTLARDAQMQGDRVLTEYYLQFADHYFRVVSETRARFEESRPRRDDWNGEEAEMSDGQDSDVDNDGDDGQSYEQRSNPRPNTGDRGNDRGDRNDNRNDSRNDNRNDGRGDGRDRQQPARPRRDFNRDREEVRSEEPVVAAEPRSPRPPRRAPRPVADLEGPGTGALPADMLPPAIGIAPLADMTAENDAAIDSDDAPAPRRRGRPARLKTEDAA
jgi:hypothetical protein